MTSRHLSSSRLALAALLVLAGGCPGETTPTAMGGTDTGTADVPVDLSSADSGDVTEVAVDQGPDRAISPLAGPLVSMDFTRASGFYSAPFPDESRRTADGLIDLTDFPNPSNNRFVSQMLAIVSTDADGFGVSAGIFFRLDGAIAPDLPALADTLSPTSVIQLISVDPTSPDYLARYPVRSHFTEDAGPFGDANLMTVLPLQGVPLLEEVLYAAVLLRDVGGETPLGVSESLATLLSGDRPDGLSETAYASYADVVEILWEASEFDMREVAGLTVFRTGAPSRVLTQVVAEVRAGQTPTPGEFALGEVFSDYCVYQTTIEMPVFQNGSPPFTTSGGGWTFDEEGHILEQGTETANLIVTVPRTQSPDAGFPLVVFARTGGGGDRPLVDRGVRDEMGVVAVPGSGPALTFARAGFAGLSVDGPHGGLRNVTNGDEQLLIFNFFNPLAMRDNIRQSALELALLPDIIGDLTIPLGACPDLQAEGDVVRFDLSHLTLMGHSMGATIAPLTLAAAPEFRAAILSGAGGSWVENVIFKLSPLPVRTTAELILRYNDRELHEFDPALSLLQWAGEPADPPMYAGAIISNADEPVHILMQQGVVDTYIMPPIANALSLSLGLDLAGAALDVNHPELEGIASLEPLLSLVGRSQIALPAGGNRIVGEVPVTALVIQHPEDGVEDGHEVVFQTEGPKHQYRCFLETLLLGTPEVPVAGALLDSCE